LAKVSFDMGGFRARRRKSFIAMGLSIAATAIGLTCLALVLGTLLIKGLAGLSPQVLTQMTPPPGADGGLLNPIAGSLLMTLLGVLMGTPIGILAGTYMAEYGRHARVTTIIRFINDVLLSAPSIVIGLFVYTLVVAPMKQFSGLAGAMALAILVIPVVVRTTEDMLRLVPDQLREAAASVGMPRVVMIRSVAYQAARAGILTGVLLAIARISGETAPLLFTALNNQFWNADILEPMASLPVVIFQFALSPYAEWQRLAWTGAMLITFAVLAFSIVARLIGQKGQQS
jgi:phosphate transport system permease protein